MEIREHIEAATPDARPDVARAERVGELEKEKRDRISWESLADDFKQLRTKDQYMLLERCKEIFFHELKRHIEVADKNLADLKQMEKLIFNA